VHLSNPAARQTDEPAWVDNFTSGSAAALAGGITTVGNMCFSQPGESPLATLERETQLAERQAIADVFLRPVLPDASQWTLADIPRLLDAGCSSIKIFLSFGGFDERVLPEAFASPGKWFAERAL
jgi:dihydropyrimidinase